MCNMSIEGGARVGYVNPDQTTIDYLRGRPFVPTGDAFDAISQWWLSMASDADAVYDDDIEIRADQLAPVVTWGVHPGQSIGVDEKVPTAAESVGIRAYVITYITTSAPTLTGMRRPDVLVLGGGGPLGEAWLRSLLAGLEADTGWDLREADAFVGTSAGSIVAATLAAGRRPRTADAWEQAANDGPPPQPASTWSFQEELPSLIES